MPEIKKLLAKVKVTQQNKGSKILLSLSEASGVCAEIALLEVKIKQLEEKLNNIVPEIVYKTVQEISQPTPTVDTEEIVKQTKTINVTGRPFRE
jgi:hypothetical protein